MTNPHPQPVVPDDSEYTAPGVAVWAPRLRLAEVKEYDDGSKWVNFVPTDNAHVHVWAVPEDAPDFELTAIVHSTVQLEEDEEYFVYVVPVKAMEHDK